MWLRFEHYEHTKFNYLSNKDRKTMGTQKMCEVRILNLNDSEIKVYACSVASVKRTTVRLHEYEKPIHEFSIELNMLF